MKRIVAKSTLKKYWDKNPESEQALKTWYEFVTFANWNSPNDVKLSFSNASILKNNRVVFNIKGNTYRLICSINYERQWVFIRFIGTHAEYDKIDANIV